MKISPSVYFNTFVVIVERGWMVHVGSTSGGCVHHKERAWSPSATLRLTDLLLIVSGQQWRSITQRTEIYLA